jgi:large subunit ribosomal protein L24
MSSFHVKKGEEVVVISGAERGKRGKIIEIQAANQRVLIEGVRMIKKHMRKSQQNPQGSIVEREGSMHLSNVMSAEKFDARATKRGGAAPAPAKS